MTPTKGATKSFNITRTVDAAHKAILDGSGGKRGRYRLVYDEEFDYQWLLLVAVATLLLR